MFQTYMKIQLALLEREKCVVKLWKKIHTIYLILNSWPPNSDEIENFFAMANQWVLAFFSLGKTLEGCDSKCVAPYIHILVYQMPHLLKI